MRFNLAVCLTLLLASFAATTETVAQDYPNRPITIIVPYTPGDGPDVTARLIGEKMSRRLGEPVVVENRAGASGQIGLATAANAEPDGYTIAVGLVTNLALAPHAYRNLPYDPLEDFTAVALMGMNYLALVATPQAPFKTTSEMIAWAKANPGKLTIGTTSVGGLPHMSFELLAHMAGFDFVNVPYKGNGPIVNDLIGGRLHLGFGSYTSAAPHIKSERLRLLGITAGTPDPQLPELPLMAEAVPGYQSMGWFGFVAPAGTPAEIVDRLNEEINRAMKEPDVAETMTTLGITPMPESPEYFAELIESEHGKFAKLVRDIGFEPQ